MKHKAIQKTVSPPTQREAQTGKIPLQTMLGFWDNFNENRYFQTINAKNIKS